MTATGPIDELIAAIQRGDGDRVREMIDADPALVSKHHPHSFGGTPLIHAVQCDDRAMVNLLLDHGADINQRSDWWAGSFGVLDHGTDSMAAYILERGATLTPHAAARLGKTTALQQMIRADPGIVHARGGDGQFPLHFAQSPEIADLLLQNGADIDGRDVDHESTAAQWSGASRTRVAGHLVQRGCQTDPFLAAMVGDAGLLTRHLQDEPGGVNMRITRKRFPTTGKNAALHIYFYNLGEDCSLMHAAATADQPDAIRWLAARGADPNARGGYDDATPLHQAAWGNCHQAVAALVDAGADINARSGKIHENEPIGWAIVSGAVEVVRVLLDRACSVRDVHREDAGAGARGQFRRFNRNRAADAWRQVESLMTGR